MVRRTFQSSWRKCPISCVHTFDSPSRTEGEGYAHITIGMSGILKPSITSTKLTESVQNAWIRLRHYAPLIALRTQQGGGDNDTFYVYESSKTGDLAAKWAQDTIKWEKEEKTLDARDLDLKER